MSLMFTRVARNFIKNGYFPTDNESLKRIILSLIVDSRLPVKILDPCCGEGSAIFDISRNLSSVDGNLPSIVTYGIEYNRERALNAVSLLDYCVNADIFDTKISIKSFSLLFLNPPYGVIVSDGEGSDNENSSSRIEVQFIKRSVPLLKPNGILVLIVPFSILNKYIAVYLSMNFTNISFYSLPEKKYKQVVIFGVKKEKSSKYDPFIVKRLTALGKNSYFKGDEVIPSFLDDCVLPETGVVDKYFIKGNFKSKLDFYSVNLVPQNLVDYGILKQGILSNSSAIFNNIEFKPSKPLTKLSDWHMALLLASGEVSGLVEGSDGSKLLVKGSTYKDKKVTESVEIDESTGDITYISSSVDRFVPNIKAIDLTKGSTNYGRIIDIK